MTLLHLVKRIGRASLFAERLFGGAVLKMLAPYLTALALLMEIANFFALFSWSDLTPVFVVAAIVPAAAFLVRRVFN